LAATNTVLLPLGAKAKLLLKVEDRSLVNATPDNSHK